MTDSTVHVPFGYLPQQFAEIDGIIADLRDLATTGDYTLGEAVAEFEQDFAAFQGGEHAIGVNSGTDALKLCFRAVGVGFGDEVVTAANTFVGTISAILDLGAKPVFVDVDDTMQMDPDQLQQSITERTKAVAPVHWAGDIGRIEQITEIADGFSIPVIEDACQAVGSVRDGKRAGAWGKAAAFSLHPQKFLNIWGDGGVILTNDVELADHLRLLRNHGLESRDLSIIPGINSRLDTVQAIVARRVLPGAEEILTRRRQIAARYDAAFKPISAIEVPRNQGTKGHSFVTYQIFCHDRDSLIRHCASNGIEAKIHYPIPIYRQPCLGEHAQKIGAFPETERQANRTVTLPVHQHLNDDQVDHVVQTVSDWFL